MNLLPIHKSPHMNKSIILFKVKSQPLCKLWLGIKRKDNKDVYIYKGRRTPGPGPGPIFLLSLCTYRKLYKRVSPSQGGLFAPTHTTISHLFQSLCHCRVILLSNSLCSCVYFAKSDSCYKVLLLLYRWPGHDMEIKCNKGRGADTNQYTIHEVKED